MDYIGIIEKALNKKATIEFLPIQKGDVLKTESNTDLLYHYTKFKPLITIDKGIKEFVEWFIKYYK